MEHKKSLFSYSAKLKRTENERQFPDSGLSQESFFGSPKVILFFQQVCFHIA